MQGEKLNAAFKEVEFSEDFEDKVLKSLNTERRKRRVSVYQRMLAIASCFILLFVSTGYAAARYYGGIEKLLGTNARSYDDYIHKNEVSMTGKLFKLTVKEYVCTKNAVTIIAGVEARTERAQQLMDEEHIYVNEECMEPLAGVGAALSFWRDDSYADKENEACFVFELTTTEDFTIAEGKEAIRVNLTSVEEDLSVCVTLSNFMSEVEIPLQSNSEYNVITYTNLILSPMSMQFNYFSNKSTFQEEEWNYPTVAFILNGEVKKVADMDKTIDVEETDEEYYVRESGGTVPIPEADYPEIRRYPVGEEFSFTCDLSKFIDMNELEAVIVDGVTYEIE